MNNIVNYFINKKKISIQLEKASFINIPGYAEHIGFWLSNKFLYTSKHHENQIAIGLIKTNNYQIIKYLKNDDGNNVRNDWRVLTGEELLLLFDKEKQLINKQFARKIKIPTKEEEQKLQITYQKLAIEIIKDNNTNKKNEDEILWN